jgi:hypothetical protein
MPRIRSSDAFGLSLIRDNPNPELPEVKEILIGLSPVVRKMAEQILRDQQEHRSGPARERVGAR